MGQCRRAKLQQELPSSTLHGGASCPSERGNKSASRGSHPGILPGQVRQALHGKRLHDSTVISQIASKNRRDIHAVLPRQLQARKHLGEMPSKFLLCCLGRQRDELNFERPKPLRIRHGEFLCCISGPHAEELVRVMHTV